MKFLRIESCHLLLFKSLCFCSFVPLARPLFSRPSVFPSPLFSRPSVSHPPPFPFTLVLLLLSSCSLVLPLVSLHSPLSFVPLACPPFYLTPPSLSPTKKVQETTDRKPRRRGRELPYPPRTKKVFALKESLSQKSPCLKRVLCIKIPIPPASYSLFVRHPAFLTI
jgi:hypothetical protein